MSERRRFVVRSAGVKYAIEYGDDHRGTELQRQKPGVFGAKIVYETDLPEGMTLRQAIALYKSGVRAKQKGLDQKGKLVLADAVREKREGRQRAKDERARTGK